MGNKDYDELIYLVKKAGILGSVNQLLSWDQEVYMPPAASEIRAMEMSTLSSLGHEIFTQKRIGELLKRLQTQELSREQKANVREISFDYHRAKKVPDKLIREFSETTVRAMEVWRDAREKYNYKLFAPWLKKIVSLNKKYARAIEPKKSAYEVIFTDYEEDITLEDVESFFDDIKRKLVPLVKKISEKRQPARKLLEKNIPAEKQARLCRHIASSIGYDFNKGRMDVSTHPFTAAYGRITTRFNEGWLPAILSTIHESGHGMYEHGLKIKHYGTPLGEARSFSVHESQSRFWENHIGRSREFWKFMLPELKKTYGIKVGLDDFYKIINMVEPGFIRVNADELTYSMHIILRYEIEKLLITGKISVDDVPKEWNKRMRKYLGITPKDDREGCLQDMHWASGGLGYFATYSLGSIISAQIYRKAETDIPELKKKTEKGDFKDLHNFLRTRIHEKGRLYPTKELIRRATGKELGTGDYISYLKEKYASLYGLQP